MVDDAWRPALNQMGVEVELAKAPKLESAVKGKAKPPVWQDWVETAPEEVTVRHCPAPEPREEM